jgi:hypothetical protein
MVQTYVRCSLAPALDPRQVPVRVLPPCVSLVRCLG